MVESQHVEIICNFETVVGPDSGEICGADCQRQSAVLGSANWACQCRTGICGMMAKMKARAAFLKTLPLELQEKGEIFRIWIQPVVQLTAKNYKPSQKVLFALNVIFKMAPGLCSCDLSPAMVAEPVNRGGVATYPVAVWVRYQFGQLFQSILKDKLQFTGTWVEGFESWAKDVGLSLNPQFYPYLQLAVVRLRPHTWIQGSCQVFSGLREKAPTPPLAGHRTKCRYGIMCCSGIPKDTHTTRRNWSEKGSPNWLRSWRGGGLKASVTLPRPSRQSTSLQFHFFLSANPGSPYCMEQTWVKNVDNNAAAGGATKMARAGSVGTVGKTENAGGTKRLCAQSIVEKTDSGGTDTKSISPTKL